MIASTAARNASLDNDYGTTAGPHAAASHEVGLLDEDGVELTSGTASGYVRATLAPADWPDAADGAKTALATFDPPTDEWPDVVAFELYDASTGDAWDTADLVDVLQVTAASDDGPVVSVTVNYTNLEGV